MNAGQQCVEGYQLLQPLGQGGMGVVWKARDERDGRLVALKTVKVPDARLFASIRREVHALAQLKHPGIVRILDEGVHQGAPWYAMEMLEGVTLRHWKVSISEALAESGESSAQAEAAGGKSVSADASQWWTGSLGPDCWSGGTRKRERGMKGAAAR